MSSTRHHAAKARLAVLTAVALALLFSVAGPVTAKEKPELTVMTQNLYLGADLTPVLSAPNPGAFLVAVAGLYAVVQASDFPTRAAAIAAEIDRNDVDIVGLQEVAKYTTSGPGGTLVQASREMPRSASGRWRTVTVPLDGAVFRNGIAGTDFRLHNGGSDDLTVRFVRLIKVDPIG